MLQLRAFAQEQQQAASAEANMRRTRVAAYLQRLHEASMKEQAQLMDAMHAVLKHQRSSAR